MILQIHECTNIRKYSEKGNVKDMNEGPKIQNMKHKKIRRKEEKCKRRKKYNVNEKGMVKGEPGTYLFWRMEVGDSCA